MKKILIIKIFDKDQEIDSFTFPFEDVPGLISLPDKHPYNGLSFNIGVDGNGGYSFSPDGYEMWIHFGDKRIGQLIEYMDGKSLKFQFKTKKAD